MTVKQISDLPIGPGVYTEQTERGAVGQWSFADKVRFRKGLAEKIGGWVQLEPQMSGTARRIRDWTSLDAQKWAAIGTERKLYLWQNETLYNITPLRDSGTLTAPFDTVMSSNIVTVEHTNHGVQVGDSVFFFNAIAGGGLTVDGEYEVDSIVDQDFYTIVDDETATSTASNTGGTPDYEYEISAGESSVVVATGYGTGPYGAEGYGDARTGSTLVVGIRTWSLDNWGEDLLACPRGGSIYWWDRTKGTGTRAEALGGDAPTVNQFMLVSQRDRHVLALGAFDFFNDTIDPLLIRWCSTEDLNDWIPTSVNTSGDLRLYSGSKIVSGVRSRLETVIFTDVSVHTLPFVGGFDVFGLNIVGENVSILGPNCAVPVDSRVFFMAEADFYVYDGIVRTLSCDVRNYVYENLNVDQKDKVYGGLNREFNEIWWFYPSRDPDAWVQQDFSLSLPPGYKLATASGGATIGYSYAFNSFGYTEPIASAVGDPNYASVVLLLHMGGTDGGTTTTDSSASNHTMVFTDDAEITTDQSKFSGSSLGVNNSSLPDQTGDALYTTIGASTDFDFGTGEFTIELQYRAEESAGANMLLTIGNTGDEVLNIVLSNGNIALELNGAAQSNAFTTPHTNNVWHHVAIQRKSDQNFECYFNGTESTSGDWVEAASIGNPVGDVILGGSASGAAPAQPFEGFIDEVRITKGVARYTGDFTAPTEEYPNSATAGYAYDYTLDPPDPIQTPLEGEYAVELDIHPDHSETRNVGLAFLKQDIVGTPNTSADDESGFFVELDLDNDAIRVRKKEPDGTFSVPDNAGTGDAVFTTVTGSAMALATKYIITAQVDTPQITVWVDGNQAFQFDMSAQELLDHTGGTAGLHVRDDFPVVDEVRFYNFAAGPIGVLTNFADFDISPIEVNRYVAFNYEEDTWTIGKMARTAWADRSPLLEKAYAAAPDGYLYQHETGTDDDGAAMTAFIESFDMEVPQAGENLMHIDQLIPDFLELEGSVDLYLSGKKYSQDVNRIEKGPYTIAQGTRKVSTRMRARQVALKIESTGRGDKWRMGTMRGRAGPHGKR